MVWAFGCLPEAEGYLLPPFLWLFCWLRVVTSSGPLCDVKDLRCVFPLNLLILSEESDWMLVLFLFWLDPGANAEIVLNYF